jgi:prepilin-type N-terminal cleavage/methylation domain-containing protein
MPDCARAERAPRGGFTLVEIMVVLALIALMAGALIPRFGSRQASTKLRTSALLLSDAFACCRSMAATEARRYKWIWDEEARMWSFLREADPLANPGEFEPTTIGGRRDQGLPEGIEVEGLYFAIVQDEDEEGEPVELPPEVQFHGDGHCTSIQVVLQVARGIEGEEAGVEPAEPPAAITVALNGVTGRVKLIEGNPFAVEEGLEDEEGEPRTNLVMLAPPEEF